MYLCIPWNNYGSYAVKKKKKERERESKIERDLTYICTYVSQFCYRNICVHRKTRCCVSNLHTKCRKKFGIKNSEKGSSVKLEVCMHHACTVITCTRIA